MKNIISILFLLTFSILGSKAQNRDLTAHPHADRLILADTFQLPFAIAQEKKLSQEDILNKKEGLFLTGLPRFEFDPIRGFGVGGNIFLFQNKTKEDPFFYYTPYRYNLSTEFFIFENGRVRAAVNLDVPYIFNSRWRLRADAVLWEDPHAQYWGIGRNFLRSLEFQDKSGGIAGKDQTFSKVADYEKNLSLALPSNGERWTTDTHYNQFMQREALFNVLAERVELGGKLRLMFGYEALFTAFEDFTGKVAEKAFMADGRPVEAIQNPTLLSRQIQDGTWSRFNLRGFDSDYQFTSMLAGALIYDTRDLEPDPSQGLFLQYSHEYSAPWLGSNFDFNKFMVQGQVFHTFHRWNQGKGKLTFAGAVSFGHIFGRKINFIEMWDLSSQAEAGGILVLGGARSLRGFREARFLAPTVGLVNLELRAKFTDFHLWKQHFSLGVTPFYDFGTVWDGIREIEFNQFKGAPGVGARIGWNQSTVLRLDYARSTEGAQVFFGFGHVF
ncbi:surface antigen-like protein [Algoriphagus aquaeductus]|uniref:Surface antigen-like protein n=1 Tax=Algoriphagus aquaeductus TaxID=475299 RepID=A0A326RRH0_9BACT|nr:DUF5982 domain-containing protein [Algoriphagus aquaeductus]PZV80842.1 surface antigen-like protein [Algoriphagus aquaeductus]